MEHTPEIELRRRGEAGGIVILVALSMLILLTIASLAMAKNSMREVITTGTMRQGAQSQNLADAGLEWSLYWMTDDLTGTRSAPSGGALAVRTMKEAFVKSTQAGVLSAVITDPDMTLYSDPSVTQKFQLYMTYMGTPMLTLTSEVAGKSSINAISPATLQLWSLRADGMVQYPGITFTHRREAWFTVPPTAITK
jgi:Tfp pilus assembly protein PilX